MNDEEKQAPANGELPKGHTRKLSVSRKPSDSTAQWMSVLRTNSLSQPPNFEGKPEVGPQAEYNGDHYLINPSDHQELNLNTGHRENGSSKSTGQAVPPASRPIAQQNSEDASNQKAQGAKDETNCCCFPKRKFKSSVQSDSPLASDAQGSDEEKMLKYLMVVHAALVQQLNSYGIVLTLLAAVTSVAILQPPGSFDQGHMISSGLVACFLMFSSLSFLLACTGLMAVIIGSASLFRPWFFPEPPGSEAQLKEITDAQAGSGNSEGVKYDSISTLGEIILDNVFRVRRLRIYLAVSLGLCMVAFVCGAFAILGPQKRNLWMATGTIVGGGGLVLAVETGMTLAGPTHPPKWLADLCIYSSGEALDKIHTSHNMRHVIGRADQGLWTKSFGVRVPES